MPPLSNSYTPDGLSLDFPATKIWASIKRVKVFTSETSHSTLPTKRPQNTDTGIDQLNIPAKKLFIFLSARFFTAVGTTTLSWTSQPGTPGLFLSHHCLSHSPHPVLPTVATVFFFFFFLVNISWIHPLPFHSHSCGLCLGFGFGPLGICGLLPSLPPHEHSKPQLNWTPLRKFLFFCLYLYN